MKNGECLQTFTGHTRYGNCCAFSKDSTLLASGSNDRTVIVWDLKQNLTLDAQLIKPCSASCHFTHNPVVSIYTVLLLITDHYKKLICGILYFSVV